MSKGIMSTSFHHIAFRKTWEITPETMYQLGQCNAIIKALSETPIQPNYRRQLLTVSLHKGALATTAIEGNTMSQEELESIIAGKEYPPSKDYQKKEVENILNALNTFLQEIIHRNQGDVVDKKLLLRMHKMVGADLGEAFSAIPGRFRENPVTVGRYKAPDYKDLEKFMDTFFEWMQNEFHFASGQSFAEAVIQAIVAHVYIAWIHPFGDGNGRTARLLEFYILLRAGNPDFASHLLSNFYNETRPEYYRQLDKSTKTGNLSDFIRYAVQGYRDGLLGILNVVNHYQFEMSWKNLVYNSFSGKNISGKTETLNKRRRNLILSIPIGHSLSVEELLKTNIEIALLYNGLSARTIKRDIDELLKMELLAEEGGKYKANTDILRGLVAKKIQR